MNNQTTVQVWDILIRIFHWSLVLSFTVAYLSSEEENPWHIYSGYIVLGLIIFRVFWGLIGSKYARFSDFIHSPSFVVAYIKSLRSGNPQHYLGHNPIGGWMVVIMLATLFVVTLSGLKGYAIEEGKGPFAVAGTHLTPISAAHADDEQYAEGDKKDEEFWEEIHEASSNAMLLLITLHIIGIVVSSRLHKESLVKAMFTGKKQS
jgi:cytochrome b